MLTKPPIWEPEGTRFRPYNISTLISFFVGRTIGRFFRFIFGKPSNK
jgi:hypothetical protein